MPGARRCVGGCVSDRERLVLLVHTQSSAGMLMAVVLMSLVFAAFGGRASIGMSASYGGSRVLGVPRSPPSQRVSVGCRVAAVGNVSGSWFLPRRGGCDTSSQRSGEWSGCAVGSIEPQELG